MEINMTDFIVIGILICIVAAVIIYMYRSKKAGKNSGCGCGSSCEGCSGHCNKN
jgi:hypothetical protein